MAINNVAAPPGDAWRELWTKIESLVSGLARSRAVNVNSTELRDQAKEIVQSYFRVVRPELQALSSAAALLDSLDPPMQRLLTLSNGRNPRRYYQQAIRQLRQTRATAEAQRELAIGQSSRRAASHTSTSIEQAILQTLQRLVPSAGLSYEQAIRDLIQDNRCSFRGVASELRECLREVLDHLAPDAQVTKSDGFVLEKGQTKPSMKQKVKFILRSRGVPSGALSSSQATIQRVEDGVGALARSVYDRGSLSTHIAAGRREVRQLKLYLDGVLAEILQIHEVEKAAG